MPPLQVHSGKLQAVLDIVLSHQGAPLKSALMQRLMSALVLPAPEHYRALLRRLAGLAEPSAADVAQRAQQLLEHSLLGELRTLVARALSGLDLFAEPQFRDLFGGATSPVGKASQLCVPRGGQNTWQCLSVLLRPFAHMQELQWQQQKHNQAA
jgi:hypothetical protein